jgi:SAM-dependent methyltransferase
VTATPASYFEECWSRGDDPWEHGSRFYESRKYALTIASLPRPHYERAFEPACGIGLLTELIAERASAVVACDRHPRAVEVARRRCAARPGVTIDALVLPDQWPPGRFDLVVCSELLYGFDASALDAVIDGLAERLERGGDLIAVHYRRHVPEHALSGDEVHRHPSRHGALERGSRYEESDFVLDVFRR